MEQSNNSTNRKTNYVYQVIMHLKIDWYLQRAFLFVF